MIAAACICGFHDICLPAEGFQSGHWAGEAAQTARGASYGEHHSLNETHLCCSMWLARHQSTMNTNRAAKLRAIQKIRTWAARLNDDQQEESHFDRLPLHLQLHIREMAKEDFAREHMQWKVHSELCFTVARRNLKATVSCMQRVTVVTEKINTLSRVLREDYQLDILVRVALSTARTRLLGDCIALSKQLWESISDLWQVYSQLLGMLRRMIQNTACPLRVVEQLLSEKDDFLHQELEPLEKQVMAVGSLQDY